MKRTAITIIAIILCICSFCSCGEDKITETIYAQIEMEAGGVITLELYGEIAPITVANFKNLAESGTYDGTTFHRISQGFMIQGGDPTGTGMGDPSLKNIKGEFSANGVENDLSHDRGVISMARRLNDMDSASSQFFICDSGDKKRSLDGQYAAFGRVIAGMDVVDKIAATPTKGETPTTVQRMKSVKIIDKATADAAVAAEAEASTKTN